MGLLSELVRKDLKLFATDKRGMLITFAVPIGIASFMAMIFGGESDSGPTQKIPLLVVDQDGSALSKDVFARMQKGDLIEPKPATLEVAQAAVKKGDAAAAAILPKGFGAAAPQAMFNSKAPTIRILFDPSKKIELQAIKGALTQTLMEGVSQAAFEPSQMKSTFDTWIASPEAKADPKLTDAIKTFQEGSSKLEATKPASEEGGMKLPFELKEEAQSASQDPDSDRRASQAHIFAGMAIQGLLFWVIDAAMGMLKDRRLGIWRRLRASPVTGGALLMGKAISTALVALFVMFGVFAFGFLVFNIKVQGSVLGFGLVAICSALMAATFGLFIAALGRSEQQARGLSVFLVLSISMLGGAWFPSFLMPAWIQGVSKATPVRWAVDGFDAMTWRGSDLSAAIIPCLALLGFALFFGIFARLRFRWDLGEGA